MASASASVVLLLFKASLLGLLFHGATAVTTHIVGGNEGWIIPTNGAKFYEQWADGETFSVGDSLVFNFKTGAHDVAKVSESDYKSCTNNTIGDVLTNSPATVTLETAGTHYYICAIPGHCLGGQKLAVDVTGSASSALANGPSANTPTGSQQPPDSSSPPSVLGVVVPAAAAMGLAALLL